MLAALLGLGVFILATIDLRPVIERMATRTLDRRVSIAAFHLKWGSPIAVEITDLRIANASWASAPDMVRVGRVSAAIDPWPLLRGVLRYRQLRVEQPVISLERDSTGIGNWKFNGGGSSAGGGLALVPKNRTQFPTLIDFALSGGAVDYRTSSGTWLRIRLHDVAIRTASGDTPVTLAATGSYNGVEVRLMADTQSFAVMRQGSVAFGAKVALTTPSSKIDFDGTMMDPLDFDGVNGKLAINASDLGALLALFGTNMPAAFPLRADGALARDKDHWALSEAKATLADNALTGRATLDEGARGKADAIGLGLDFARLDLTPLLSASSGGDVSLALDPHPGATVAARITARDLVYGRLALARVALAGRSAPSALELSALSFAFAGGQVDAAASARSVDSASQINVSAALSGGDAGQLAAALGAASGQIAGRLDGAAHFDMTGSTLSNALKTSNGRAVLAMTEGRVARDLLEKASTDLRVLFRAGEGTAAVTCLLGVMTVQHGIGTIAPLALHTPDTNLEGGGTIDLVDRTIDLTIKADKSASILALAIPLRLSGDLSAPHITPALGASLPDPPNTADITAEWRPALRDLAARNACLR
jgi:AsmA family protein